MRLLMAVTGVVCTAALGCSGKSPESGCRANSDCAPGEVCSNGRCEQVCVTDFQCPEGQICPAGVCVDGQSLAPEITGVDGDGSLFCPAANNTHCMTTGLWVTGANLEGAAFTLLPQGSPTEVTVEIAGDGSSTRKHLVLPAETAAGFYTLVASNRSGSADQVLQLLQGEPGPQLTPNELVAELNQATVDLDVGVLPVGTTSAHVALGSHTHDGSEITGGTVPFDRLPVGAGATQVAQGDHTHTFPDARIFERWGSTLCPAGYTTLYTGYGYQAGVNNGHGTDFVCATGTRTQVFRHYTGEDWESAPTCAVCASANAAICYTKWGDTTCGTGFTSQYTGYMFTPGQNDGYGGRFVCSSTTQGTNYSRIAGAADWENARPCAVCCSD
jgi:Cys-rich repeat protein